MKFSVAIITAALAALIHAAPAADPAPITLPEGFAPITRDEILRRLAKPADSL